MLHESRIAYERGRHWAYEESPGHFTIWRNCASGCGATKRATIAFPDRPEHARARAINEVNRRED